MSRIAKDIVMGANASQINADDGSSFRQDIADPHPPPKPTLRYQRLPPIESRENVRGQVARVQTWGLADSDDELYQSITIQTRISPPNTSTRSNSKRAPTPPLLSPSKKRRLIPTSQALTIASEEVNLPEEINEQNNSILYQDDDRSSHPIDDEGYSSYVVSPPSDSKDLTEDEREEQWVRTLATLQRPNIILAKPVVTTYESARSAQGFSEEGSMEEAKGWMLQDQEKAAEKSKMLRERNLARRQLPEPWENTENMAAEQQPTWPTGGADLFSDVEDQSSNREKLLDIAERHILQTSNSQGQPKRRDTLKTHRHRSDPDAVNPASRIAAEQYRTQSRHISTWQEQQQQQQPFNPRDVDLEERESRLRELTTIRDTAKEAMNNVRSPRLDNQFNGDDFKHRLPVGGRSETPPAMLPVSTAKPPRESMTTSQSQRVNQTSPVKRLSGLEMLSVKRGINSRPDKARKVTIPPGPKRGLTLPSKFESYDEEEQKVIVEHEIAKERKRDLEMIERVTLAIAQLRCLGKFTDMDEKELLEVRKFMTIVIDNGKCAKLKRPRIQNIRDNMRRRASGFQEPSEDEVAIWMKRVFNQSDLDLVKAELVKVEEEVADLGALRNTFSQRRHNTRTRLDKRRNRERKQVRFAGSQNGDSPTSTPTPTPRKPRRHSQGGGDATQNRRQAQYTHQDRLHETLTAKLKLFDEAAQQASQVIGLPGSNASPSEPEQREDSRTESEEDGGAQFVYGAGLYTSRTPASEFTAPSSFPESTQEVPIVQDIEEINRLEDARQIRSGSHALQRSTAPAQATPQGSQRFDPGLLKQMQTKQVQEPREPATGPAAEQLINHTKAVIESNDTSNSDSSSIESSEDECEDGHEEGRRQVYKYTVMGAFAGVDIYKDADAYIFKSTYKAESAKAYVGKIIQSVLRQFPPSGGIDAGHWSLDVVHRDGLIEQHLMVGEDMTVEARVWIEKKLVDLDQKAYRAAKARKIIQQRFLFAVYWEKTVTPVVPVTPSIAREAAEIDGRHQQQQQQQQQHNNERSVLVESRPRQHQHRGQDQGQADMDDLFGDDDDLPMVCESSSTFTPTPEIVPVHITEPQPVPIVSTIPTNEIQYFTTPVLANRHAKDIYMAWHATFLPGWRNEGYRRLQDDAVEQDLKALGTWGLWSREESFERTQAEEEEVSEKGAAISSSKVEETFKVWVRRIEVFGPGN